MTKVMSVPLTRKILMGHFVWRYNAADKLHNIFSTGPDINQREFLSDTGLRTLESLFYTYWGHVQYWTNIAKLFHLQSNDVI